MEKSKKKSKESLPSASQKQTRKTKKFQKIRSRRCIHQEKCNSHPQQRTKVFFIPWEGANLHFLDGVEFEKGPKNFQMHLFYAKGTTSDRLPNDAKWIFRHESLTDSKEAMWVDLTAYIVNFYTRIAVETKCQDCSIDASRYNMKLVCNEDDKSRELIALMKANKVDIEVIDGRNTKFIDMFEHVCSSCKLIFDGNYSAKRHDDSYHNFLCHNQKCERSKRGNGFFTQNELEKHIRAQKSCRFCLAEVFCTNMKFMQHIRDNHRQCPCPCGEYYDHDDDFIEHFYASYPLPCLEKLKCKARFKNIEAQAFHHESIHGSQYPFYCMACFKKQTLVCLRTADALLNHVADKNHQEEDFMFAVIPKDILEGNNCRKAAK